MLEKLDLFLKRIEPEIESITGEERDTASFMKMMRLFNEVRMCSGVKEYISNLYTRMKKKRRVTYKDSFKGCNVIYI